MICDERITAIPHSFRGIKESCTKAAIYTSPVLCWNKVYGRTEEDDPEDDQERFDICGLNEEKKRSGKAINCWNNGGAPT